MSNASSAPAIQQVAGRIVVAYPYRADAPPHARASHKALARKLAQLLECEFQEEFEPAMLSAAKSTYYVPTRTLVRSDAGTQPSNRFINDIVADQDLFGGIVPYPFVATKAISHPVLHADSPTPHGWSHDFGRAIEPAVLRGATVFSLADARMAAWRLMAIGPVRIKPVRASGGRGQLLIRHPDEFEAALSGLAEAEITHHGLVIEEHLEEVETLSVGQAWVGNMMISYVGTQLLTPDNNSQLVYGGSSLRCVRGDYERLIALGLNHDEQEAVRLARLYDMAAERFYPGLYASRRNYDVAIGLDAQGHKRMGVLEQSWRAGGASYAEACAIETFMAMPDLAYVQTCTRECYGPSPYVPRHAQILFQGDDPEIGLVTKYGAVESYGYIK